MSTAKRHGLFKSPSDLLSLEIIDFNRLNGSWANPGAAMDTIFSHLRDGRASYVVYDVPEFWEAPLSPGFPEWNHVGNHPAIGRQLWNWFRWRLPEYELKFMDSPDFCATRSTGGRTHFIWGDIGTVSASAFAYSQKLMRQGDMWMSILDDGSRHVLIDHHASCMIDYGKDFGA